jgi:hypothetical protein
MAADILFGKNRMWSARMVGFCELLERVQKISGHDLATYLKNFAIAKTVECLDLDQIENRDVRMRLAQCILLAATGWLEELRADSTTSPGEIKGIQKLVALSEEYLKGR